MAKWLIRKEDIDYDLNEVYKPLNKALNPVINALDNFDIDLQMGTIARMLIHYKLPYKRHRALKKEIESLLKLALKYEKTYFDIKRGCGELFDKLMKKYGYYAPDTKEYKYLKIEFFRPVIMENERETWIMSFKNRIGALERTRSNGMPKKTPEDILEIGIKRFRKKVEKLKNVRTELLARLKDLKKRLERAIKEPERPWEYWQELDKDKDKDKGAGG